MVVTFEQRHKENDEASSTDISGGKAFEANKIAEGRTVLGMFEQLQGDSEAGWVGEREQDGEWGRPGTEQEPSGTKFKLLYFQIIYI